MGDPPARTVLAREALRAARAARSEPEFFALLERARLRAAPDQAGRPAGWSVTLPGLADGAGQPGAGPGPGWFTGRPGPRSTSTRSGPAGPALPGRRPTC